MDAERIAEVREQAGYASVVVGADELLWLLDELEQLNMEVQRHQVGDSYGVGYEHGSALAARYKAQRDQARAELPPVRRAWRKAERQRDEARAALDPSPIPRSARVQAAADYAGISRTTAYRYIRNGRLRAYLVGSVLRVSLDDVDRLIRPAPGPVTGGDRS